MGIKDREAGINGDILHLIAMITMLIDHSAVVLFDNNIVLRGIGRLAFPIFCFLIAEGFKHTSNLTNYIGRLMIFGIISEIPFNLMVSDTIIDYSHQNVMWTLMWGLCGMYVIDRLYTYLESKDAIKDKIIPIILICMTFIIGNVIGDYFRVDYGGTGVVMVMSFYFIDKGIFGLAITHILQIILNVYLIGSRNINIYGVNIPLQAFALAALIPIGLYNSTKKRGNRAIRLVGYAFYPVHIIVLKFLERLI